jgi:carbonic anhydrase
MAKRQVFTYLLLLTFVTGCGGRSKRYHEQYEESMPEPLATTEAPAQPTPIATEDPNLAPEPMQINLKKDVVYPQAPAHKSHRTPGPVEWSKSLGWLKNGNTRFVRGSLRRDGQSRSDVKRLAKGQKPHAVILSCSDSRVPPEIAFDQKLGEIFVIRVAGEALDASVVGSIEYAVEHLGTNLIVVMGHTQCGAVTAALSTLQGGDAGSPDLNSLVHDIQPRLSSFADKTPSKGLVHEVWANTIGVAKDLYERSAIVRNAVDSGEAKIVQAVYSMDTGVVTFQ